MATVRGVADDRVEGRLEVVCATDNLEARLLKVVAEQGGRAALFESDIGVGVDLWLISTRPDRLASIAARALSLMLASLDTSPPSMHVGAHSRRSPLRAA